MLDVIAYLTEECCAGHPEACGVMRAESACSPMFCLRSPAATRSNAMSSIQIFDPALCCSSGVCGTEVDQALVTFAADLAWAKEQGVAIERFNLAQQPMQFAETPAVSAFLTHAGRRGCHWCWWKGRWC